MLEKQQKRITKWIYYRPSYVDRLKFLNLLPMSLYFQLLDVKFFLKLLKNPKFNIRQFVVPLDEPKRNKRVLEPLHIYKMKLCDGYYFSRIVPLINEIYKTCKLNVLDPNTDKRDLEKVFWTYFISSYSNSGCAQFYKCYCCT